MSQSQNSFVIADVLPGKLNALVKNIMRQTGAEDPNEAVRVINSQEWVITKPGRRWSKKGGVIYFTLPVTDGKTGREWIEYFEKKGVSLPSRVRCLLMSENFKPTKGVEYQIAVLSGRMFDSKEYTTQAILEEASRRQFKKVNMEVACLIIDTFSRSEILEMGFLWIVAMHDFAPHCGEDLLGFDTQDDAESPFTAFYSDGWRSQDRGFVFELSQIQV